MKSMGEVNKTCDFSVLYIHVHSNEGIFTLYAIKLIP